MTLLPLGGVVSRACATLAILTVFAAPLFGQPRDPQAFLAHVSMVVNSRDAAAMNALFDLDGATDDARKTMIEYQIGLLVSDPVVIELVPLDDDFQSEWLVDSIRHRLDVAPLGRVQFAVGKTPAVFRVVYGHTDEGTVRFARVVSEATGYVGPPDVGFTVTVQRRFSRLNGDCLITRSGVQDWQTIAVDDSTSFSRWFVAQSIESCELTAASGATGLRLEIKREAAIVFDSGETRGNVVRFRAPRQP